MDSIVIVTEGPAGLIENRQKDEALTGYICKEILAEFISSAIHGITVIFCDSFSEAEQHYIAEFDIHPLLFCSHCIIPKALDFKAKHPSVNVILILPDLRWPGDWPDSGQIKTVCIDDLMRSDPVDLIRNLLLF